MDRRKFLLVRYLQYCYHNCIIPSHFLVICEINCRPYFCNNVCYVYNMFLLVILYVFQWYTCHLKLFLNFSKNSQKFNCLGFVLIWARKTSTWSFYQNFYMSKTHGHDHYHIVLIITVPVPYWLDYYHIVMIIIHHHIGSIITTL